MGMHGLHAVDKSQNRNNYSPRTVDNLVDGVDRYASIHRLGCRMNMQRRESRKCSELLLPEKRLQGPVKKALRSTGPTFLYSKSFFC